MCKHAAALSLPAALTGADKKHPLQCCPALHGALPAGVQITRRFAFAGCPPASAAEGGP